MARYQSIIDVLIDTGCFEKVYFEHETELAIPYRGIGFLKRSALQERRGKGKDLQKKWADVCAIQNGKVKVLVEEERKATDSKVRKDIEIISKCKYLWVDGAEFPLDAQCVLFILLNDNLHGVQERVISNVGSLKTVVICNKESFSAKYAEYGTLPAH